MRTATILASVERAGIDLAAVAADLEREGVRAFCASYRELLACLTTKLHQHRGAAARSTSSTPDRERRAGTQERLV